MAHKRGEKKQDTTLPVILTVTVDQAFCET